MGDDEYNDRQLCDWFRKMFYPIPSNLVPLKTLNVEINRSKHSTLTTVNTLH